MEEVGRGGGEYDCNGRFGAPRSSSRAVRRAISSSKPSHVQNSSLQPAEPNFSILEIQ